MQHGTLLYQVTDTFLPKLCSCQQQKDAHFYCKKIYILLLNLCITMVSCTLLFAFCNGFIRTGLFPFIFGFQHSS